MAAVEVQPYDPQGAPPPEVVDVLERGLVEVTRRVEFYEADAITRWNPDIPDEEVFRLIDGGVTVDYNSDERRKLDLTLDNEDQRLRPNPNGGLWYDKVIKCFRGVRYAASDVDSPLVIIEAEDGTSQAYRTSQTLASLGFDTNTVDIGETDLGVLKKYTHIVSVMTDAPTAYAATLKQMFDQGKTVLTIGTGNGTAELPHYSTAPDANLITDSEPDTAWWTTSSVGVGTISFVTDSEGRKVVRLTRVATGALALYGGRSITPPIAASVPGTVITMGFTIESSVNQTITSSIGYAVGGSTSIGGTTSATHNMVAGVKQTYIRTVTLPSGAWDGLPLFPKFTPPSAGVAPESFQVGDVWWVIGDGIYGIAPVAGDSPTAGSFTSEAATPATRGTRPGGVAVGTQRLAVWPSTGTPTYVTAALARNAAGGFWLDIHLPNIYGAQARNLLRTALNYMKNIEPYLTWETQLGEFYIDSIGQDNFPDTVKISGRDGTKKLMNSKISRNMIFPIGKNIRDFVIEECANAGLPVDKMRLNIGAETMTSEMAFTAGTSRWDMIKSALDSFNYERFFDGFGNFVVRKFLDPSTTPPGWMFLTGPEGNLVTYSKSVNDSRIFNHVIVTAEPTDSDSSPLGYFGEAIVTDTTLPTHPDRIGDRVLPVDAPWVSSDDEAEQLAEDRLKITALESYELNFSSIYYAWLECGEIIDIEDPDALPLEPSRFLMDSIDYPFGLGPMSATGKRVTFVGSPGG